MSDSLPYFETLGENLETESNNKRTVFSAKEKRVNGIVFADSGNALDVREERRKKKKSIKRTKQKKKTVSHM